MIISANATSMKKCILFFNLILLLLAAAVVKPVFVDHAFAFTDKEATTLEETKEIQPRTLEELPNKPTLYSKDSLLSEPNEKPTVTLPEGEKPKPKASLLAIVIDDFGGFERTGVDELLNSNIDITCAIIPFVDYSKEDYSKAVGGKKEVILHMPMQAHVNLPESWYGPVYIGNYENPTSAIEKLEKCLKEFPNAKGFNIHIGSGASRNKELMEAMYKYADSHNMFFLDSRTILDDKCEDASKSASSVYLGRDVFLEPEKNRSYAGVTYRLNEAANIAKEKGYAIAIGHVGAEGGINTARAIIDFSKTLEGQNIKIVPLSTVYNYIKDNQFK